MPLLPLLCGQIRKAQLHILIIIKNVDGIALCCISIPAQRNGL